MVAKNLLRILIIGIYSCLILFIGFYVGGLIGFKNGSDGFLKTINSKTMNEAINKPTTSINNDIGNTIDIKKVKAKKSDSLKINFNIITPTDNNMDNIFEQSKEDNSQWCIEVEKLSKRTIRLIEKDLK